MTAHRYGDITPKRGNAPLPGYAPKALAEYLGDLVLGEAADPNTLQVTVTGGTQVRALADILGDYINAHDIGVVGDGVTDDTAALNAWVQAGGGRLYFPPGEYMLSGTAAGEAWVIDSIDNFSIIGAGRYHTIFKLSSFNGFAQVRPIRVSRCNDWEIIGIGVDGQRSLFQAEQEQSNGIHIRSCKRWRVKHGQFVENRGDGINLGKSDIAGYPELSDGLIEDCDFDRNDRNGVTFGGHGFQRVSVINNRFGGGIDTQPIDMEPTADGRFQEIRITNNTFAASEGGFDEQLALAGRDAAPLIDLVFSNNLCHIPVLIRDVHNAVVSQNDIVTFYTIKVTAPTGDFTLGESVTGEDAVPASVATGQVEQWDADNGLLHLINVTGDWTTAVTVTGDTSTQSASVAGTPTARDCITVDRNTNNINISDNFIHGNIDATATVYMREVSSLFPAHVNIKNNKIISDKIAVFAQDIDDLILDGNYIVRNNVDSYAVQVHAQTENIARMRIIRNYIEGGSNGIYLQVATGKIFELPDVSHNHIKALAARTTAVNLSSATATIFDLMTFIGNTKVNYTDMIRINHVGDLLIGGSEGQGAQYSVKDTPEGALTAPIGSSALQRNGGAGTTLYVKESGTGNTGWVAK